MRLGLCFTVATTQEEAHLSLGSRHTRLQRLLWKRVKVDSSLHNTFAQSALVQLAWSRHHASRATLFAALTSGFFCARQFLSSIERSAQPIVRAETCFLVFFLQIVCIP